MENKIEAINKYKDKYQEEVLNELLEEAQEIGIHLIVGESWEDIKKSLMKDVEDRFDANKITGHKYVIPNSNDSIVPYIKDLIGSMKEHLLLFELDDNNHILKCHHLGEGTNKKTNITIKEIIEFLLKNNINRFSTLHNHPRNAVAMFSVTDAKIDLKISLISKILDLKFVDSMVLTDFDFASRYQLEHGVNINHQTTVNKKSILQLDELCESLDSIHDSTLRLWLQNLFKKK